MLLDHLTRQGWTDPEPGLLETEEQDGAHGPEPKRRLAEEYLWLVVCIGRIEDSWGTPFPGDWIYEIGWKYHMHSPPGRMAHCGIVCRASVTPAPERQPYYSMADYQSGKGAPRPPWRGFSRAAHSSICL